MAADPVNIFEYEQIAKERIEQGHYDFIAGGATDEITIRRTRAVFDSIMLRPRMMVDVENRSMATTVLGQEIAMPVMLDPAGNHSSAHPEAEIATVKAAGAMGTVMVLSSHASRTLEDVAESASGPLWFQQYFFKDRGLTLEMAARAEEAGYSAICMTLDAKIKPKRERNIRNGYVGADSPTMPSWTSAPTVGSSPRTPRPAPATSGTLRPRGTIWNGSPQTFGCRWW